MPRRHRPRPGHGGTGAYCFTDAEHRAIFDSAIERVIREDAASGVLVGMAIGFGQVEYESRMSTFRIPSGAGATWDAAIAAFNAAPVGDGSSY